MFRVTVTAQAIYALITGVWPLIHITSFLEVTGPKTDIWLVKTVGALLIPVSACLSLFVFIRALDKRPAVLLGGLCSIAFICIDFYYALTDVISDVYLLDGIIQIGFLVCWIYISIKYKHELLQRQRFSNR
jgi:hypothetical protein